MSKATPAFTPEQIAETIIEAQELFAFDQRVEQQARRAANCMSRMSAIIEQLREDAAWYKKDRDAWKKKHEEFCHEWNRLGESSHALRETQRVVFEAGIKRSFAAKIQAIREGISSMRGSLGRKVEDVLAVIDKVCGAPPELVKESVTTDHLTRAASEVRAALDVVGQE